MTWAMSTMSTMAGNDGFPIVRKLSSTVMWRLLIPQRGQGPLARLGISPWMWNRLNG